VSRLLRSALVTALVVGMAALVYFGSRVDSDGSEGSGHASDGNPGSDAAIDPGRSLIGVDRESVALAGAGMEPHLASGEPSRMPRHSGRVVSRRGAPVPGALVWYETESGRQISTTTDGSGEFLLTHGDRYPITVHASRNAYLERTTVVLTDVGFTEPVQIETGIDVIVHVVGARAALSGVTAIPTSMVDEAPGQPIRTRQDSGMEFSIEGVSEGERYDIWIPPNSIGEFLLARAVVLTSAGASLSVSRCDSYINGTVVAPRGVSAVDCFVILRKGLAFMHQRVNLPSRIHLGPIPQGSWAGLARAVDSDGVKWSWDGALMTQDEPTIVLGR